MWGNSSWPGQSPDVCPDSYWVGGTVVLQHEATAESYSCHRLARGSLASHCPCTVTGVVRMGSGTAAGRIHSIHGDGFGRGWDPRGRAGPEMLADGNR